jgi:glutamyl-tRNA(Gln) amidotransferase subunit E
MSGLKIGVEIHQQLDSHKLFCECPSELRSDNPDIIAQRRLYAVAGESGKIDAAAAFEESRKRTSCPR